jgi:hypothetical protein
MVEGAGKMNNEQKLTDLMLECEDHEILSAMKNEIERRFREEWAELYVVPHMNSIDEVGVFYFVYQLIKDYSMYLNLKI